MPFAAFLFFAGGLREPCFLRPEACEGDLFVSETARTAFSREAAEEEARGGGGMEELDDDDDELDAAAAAVAVVVDGSNLSRAAAACRFR